MSGRIYLVPDRALFHHTCLIRMRADTEATVQMTISMAGDNHFTGMHSVNESTTTQSASVIPTAQVLFLVLTLTASMCVVPPALF